MYFQTGQVIFVLEWLALRSRIPLKTPSGRRPGWEAFVLGYTLESKVRPLHREYVSVTTLYLSLSFE
jgi:hypothetical protein